MATNGKTLAGKVAVVTGASKGIGAAAAKHLAAAGASVVVNYSSSKGGADKVVGEITAAGGKAVAVQADVSKSADVDRLFETTKAEYGRLDVLVNNAGIYDFAPLGEITEEHFHKQFNLNVLGLILATKKAAEMFGDGGGSVVNVSSIVGIIPVPNGSVYSATKGAVDALTKAYSRELGGRKIRVNAVNPGMVETEGTQGFMGTDFANQAVAATPLGRMGQPDDIARVVTFLASDDAGWVTGATLVAAGGTIMT